jgi:hypothetical protein
MNANQTKSSEMIKSVTLAKVRPGSTHEFIYVCFYVYADHVSVYTFSDGKGAGSGFAEDRSVEEARQSWKRLRSEGFSPKA